MCAIEVRTHHYAAQLPTTFNVHVQHYSMSQVLPFDLFLSASWNSAVFDADPEEEWETRASSLKTEEIRIFVFSCDINGPNSSPCVFKEGIRQYS